MGFIIIGMNNAKKQKMKQKLLNLWQKIPKDI